MFRLYLSAVVIALTCVHLTFAFGEAKDTARVRDYVFKGMRANRERLQRGAFRAHGVYKSQGSTPASKLEGNVEILCAFDYAAGTFRFDRLEPARLISGDKVVDRMGGKLYRTPKETVIWPDGAPAAGVYPPDHPNDGIIKPFDVRAVGLYLGGSLDAGAPFEEMWRHFSVQKYETISEERKGLFQLKYVAKSTVRASHVTLWIDEGAGFAPVRFETRHPDPKNPGKWLQPSWISQSSWSSVNGVWVPKTYRTEVSFPGQLTRSYDLAFEWEAVNQPLNQALFTKVGLELKPGTFFMRREGGNVIVEGAAGVKNFPMFGPEGPLPKESRNWMVITGIAAAAVGLSLSGALWYVRRMRGRAASGANP